MVMYPIVHETLANTKKILAYKAALFVVSHVKNFNERHHIFENWIITIILILIYSNDFLCYFRRGLWNSPTSNKVQQILTKKKQTVHTCPKELPCPLLQLGTQVLFQQLHPSHFQSLSVQQAHLVQSFD